MSRRRDHGYNFIYRDGNAILDDDDADDTIYALSDHEEDYEFSSLHHDEIIEPDISGVDNNINNKNADNNTDDSNADVHDDAEINTTDNTDVLQPPNYANTKDEDTKDVNTEYKEKRRGTGCYRRTNQ